MAVCEYDTVFVLERCSEGFQEVWSGRFDTESEITCVDISENGEWLAVATRGDERATIQLRNLKSDSSKSRELACGNTGSKGIAFSPDGTLLAAWSTGVCKLWRVRGKNGAFELLKCYDGRRITFLNDATFALTTPTSLELHSLAPNAPKHLLRLPLAEELMPGPVVFKPEGDGVFVGGAFAVQYWDPRKATYRTGKNWT